MTRPTIDEVNKARHNWIIAKINLQEAKTDFQRLECIEETLFNLYYNLHIEYFTPNNK